MDLDQHAQMADIVKPDQENSSKNLSAEKSESANDKIFKTKSSIPTGLSAEATSEWTLVYSDSNSSIFDSSSDLENENIYFGINKHGNNLPILDVSAVAVADFNDDLTPPSINLITPDEAGKPIKDEPNDEIPPNPSDERRLSIATTSSSIILFDDNEEDHDVSALLPAEQTSDQEGLGIMTQSNDYLENYGSSDFDSEFDNEKDDQNEYGGSWLEYKKWNMFEFDNKDNNDDEGEDDDDDDDEEEEDEEEEEEDDEDDDDEDEDEDENDKSPSMKMIKKSFKNSFDSEESDTQIKHYDFSIATIRKGHDRIRAYFHQPNPVLNKKLNLALVLILTAAIGLGIGNFIGWSEQWNKQNQQQKVFWLQAMKLKHIQDGLSDCVEDQQLESSTNADINFDSAIDQVCVSHENFWRERFQRLFEENPELKDLFVKVQQNLRQSSQESIFDYDMDFSNLYINEEFQKLNLDFLVKQLEYLQLLEVIEDVDIDAKIFDQSDEEMEILNETLEAEEEKLREMEMAKDFTTIIALLNKENQELREAIKMNDVQDQQIIQSLQSKVTILASDNHNFRQFLDHLEKQILSDQFVETVANGDVGESMNFEQNSHERTQSEYNETLKRYNMVRQRVNQLMAENEELKTKLARYRWTDHSNAAMHQQQNDTQVNDDDDKIKQAQQQQTSEVDSKQIEQLKIRLAILNRKLLLVQDDNRRLTKRYDQLFESNKRLTLKLEKNNRKKGVEHKSVENDDAFDQFFVNEDDDDQHEDDKNKDNNDEDKQKIWSSFMDKMSDNYNHWSKKFMDLTSPHQEQAENDAQKILDYGMDFVKSTVESVHSISEKLFDGLGSGKKNQNMVEYFSERFQDFSKMIEKSMKSSLNELKSIISPAFAEDESILKKTDKNYISQKRRKILKKLDKQQQYFSKKQWKKMEKKLEKLAQTMKDVAEEDGPNEWLMDRAEGREQARLLKRYKQFKHNWLLKRAKGREKNRDSFPVFVD